MSQNVINTRIQFLHATSEEWLQESKEDQIEDDLTNKEKEEEKNYGSKKRDGTVNQSNN